MNSSSNVEPRYDEPSYCPLCKKVIDVDICYDICMVVENLAPEWAAPQEIRYTPDNKQTCKACPTHM